jgi:ABC-2 type transport system permease protein
MNYSSKLYSIENQVSDIISTVSPINDFGGSFFGLGTIGIGGSMLTKNQATQAYYTPWMPGTGKEVSLLDSIAFVWVKLLALIIYLVVTFGISYVVFMRMDIR